MATTKLTLSMEPDVVYQAKKYAKQHNISLSKLIETYLQKLATPDDKSYSVPKSIRKLRGIVKGEKNVTKEDLLDIRNEYFKDRNGS